MTNDQLEDTIRTLLDRIEALEYRADNSLSNKLTEKIEQEIERRIRCIENVNERLDNHAEQIKIVDGKVMAIADAMFRYATGVEKVLKK